MPTLNAYQRALYDVVVDALAGGPGSWVSRGRLSNTFFVDSPGGCGKTYIFNLLLEVARRDGRVALAVASSGIAALLLDGGKTAHSQLKIPVNIHADSLCNVSASSELAELLRATELIMWDEAPMMHKHCFEAVDRTLQDLTCRDDLFGGKIVVLGGDFRQVLPVVNRGTRAAIVNSCLKRSYIWGKLRTLQLHINMRVQRLLSEGHDASELQRFSETLLGVGEDAAGTQTFCIPESMCAPTEHPRDLIGRIFGNLSTDPSAATASHLTSRALLTPCNEDVNQLNNMVMASFPGKMLGVGRKSMFVCAHA